MIVYVKRCRLGRPVAKSAKPIVLPQKNINVGYGKGKLRPDGARDPRSECRQFAKLTQAINGMSGQLTG